MTGAWPKPRRTPSSSGVRRGCVRRPNSRQHRPTGYRLSSTIGPEFSNLTILQQALIGRHAPPGARLDVLPNCSRRGAADVGPGDWTCNLYVYLPQPKSVPFQQTSVDYDASVEYNGCYKAQSPPAFLGGPTMQDANRKGVTNPLFIVYGCFNNL